MSFPYHTVPDGNVWLPHHFTWAAVLALVLLATVWDDYPHCEPLWAALGLVFGLLCFLPVWGEYPVIGATGALLGLSMSTVALLRPVAVEVEEGGGWALWWLQHYPPWVWAAILVLVLVGWDDVLEHALGWWTPLDQLWRVDGYGLKKLMPSH